MPRLTETASLRTKLPTSGVRWLRCSEIKTFAVRLTPTSRAYTVRPRYKGRKVLITIGKPGVFPFEGPPHAPGARDIAIVVPQCRPSRRRPGSGCQEPACRNG